MEDTAMTLIIQKTKQQINQLIEKAAVNPSVTNAAKKKIPVTVQVDTSDEQNVAYKESSNIFSLFNRASDIASLKIDVRIDEDVEEDQNNSISEDGKDTVYGQGTPPKPEDETYLNLLKNTKATPKVKVKIK